MGKNMIGLVSVSFRNNKSKEIIKSAYECGLNCIEWGSDVHAPACDVQKIKDIKNECDAFGIECSSYGTYFKIGENSSEELYDYINAARILGTDTIRLWCGNKNADEYSPDEKNLFVEQCVKLAEIAQREDVKLCMECHNNSFVSKKEAALYLMKAVSSPNFRMYWQPNPFAHIKDNLEYAKELSQYTELIHVFNWSGCSRYPLGESMDVWKSYLACFNKDIPLLLEFMPDDRIESLKEEVNALKEIVKGSLNNRY